LLKTATVIQRVPTDQFIKFGPNPVSSELTIQFPSTLLIEAVRITSFSGKEIYKETVVENPLTVDLSAFADGPYLLEVSVEKEDNVFPMVPSGASVSDIRLE
jgi:hypothetical protein